MKLSIENTLANAPSDRSADTRSGISGMKWYVTRSLANVYSGIELRSPRPSGCLPGAGGLGAKGVARWRPASRSPALPGRALCVLLHTL